MGDPELSTGLISIATNGEPLPLKPGSLNRNIPGMLVAFLSQSFPSFRNWVSLSFAVVAGDPSAAVSLLLYSYDIQP
jgi:hypothetical protein